MNKDLFLKLSYVLVEVVGNRKIVNLSVVNKTRCEGVFVGRDGKEHPLFITYFPKKKTMKSSTDVPRFKDYRLDIAPVKSLQEMMENGTTYEDLTKGILTKKELYEKLLKGEMKFDLKGHYAGYNGDNKPMEKLFVENYIRQYERERDGASGKFDGTWSEREGESMAKVNKSMRSFYAAIVERSLAKNDKIYTSSDDKKCSACGKSLEIVLADENTLAVYPGFRMQEDGDFDIVCKHPSGPPHSRGEINVAGDLVFMNFFPDMKADCPEKEQYSDKYDLCSFSGRRNITEWKCKNQNVAYGQMGNMGLSVWHNKNVDRVILTECYMEEEPKKLRWLKKNGFKRAGRDSISLSVWRWEATDWPTLAKVSGKTFEELKEESKKDYKDVISIPAKHGRWEFTHYYDTTPDPDTDDEPFIYAELKLKHEPTN